MTSDQRLATLYAAAAWSNVSNGITFTRSGESSGFVYFTDARTDVKFDDFELYKDYGDPPGASGFCFVTQDNNYNKFDILMNTNTNVCTWGDGNSSSYLDRQGNITHEFGHAAGLAHNNTLSGVTPQNTPPSTYQTMYYSVYDALGNNLTYHWRTLESDDISGVQAVAAKIK